MKKSEILDFIQSSPAPVTKREIARAFNIKGGDRRIELKKTLKAMTEEGAITKLGGGTYGVPDGLPGVTVVEVIDIDIDGDVFAIPVDWDLKAQGEPPRIEIMPGSKGHPSLKPKDRALVRLNRIDGNQYEARVIKRFDTPEGRVMGLVKTTKHGGLLQPADKKARHEFEISQADMNGAKDGDLAVGEIMPSRGMKRKKIRITEVIGRRDDPKAISIISLNEAGLNEKFPDEVIKEAENLKLPLSKERVDLRDIPLVTIDGADARDFDDAVFASKTDDGGYHLIVAIADVAYYVRTDSALDKEAQKRGNSTYFPDRVVPMLPEALSNDLCSLRPKEDRACLAMHMWIDSEGQLTRHKIERGLMCSQARLTYEQVQAAMDGIKDDTTDMLLDNVIKPLYEAFYILDKARQKRSALDLDLPERQVIIDNQGNMTGLRQRDRLDSHKLIEEFMVLANVAAAQSLEAKKAPCVYRIHDKPKPDRLDSAREFIESFNLSLPKGQVIKPAMINRVLQQAKKLPYSHLISIVILRTQAQANYSCNNIGHFGLALRRYAHFTSPIRRYADLLVHRSLISAYGLGEGSIDEGEIARLEEICDHLSQTERTSMGAERSAIDRFTAAFLSDSIGSEFSGRITGVTRFGLFVQLDESGADGLVPMRSLPDDYYIHDEHAHALIGRRHGRVYRMGASVTARLMEADGLTGSTVLNLVGHNDGADIPGMELDTRKYSDQQKHRPDRKKRRNNFKKKRRS